DIIKWLSNVIGMPTRAIHNDHCVTTFFGHRGDLLQMLNQNVLVNLRNDYCLANTSIGTY
ncbi:hypothetical protein ACNHUJ_004483, partial [Vibrio vulnificus]